MNLDIENLIWEIHDELYEIVAIEELRDREHGTFLRRRTGRLSGDRSWTPHCSCDWEGQITGTLDDARAQQRAHIEGT